MVEHARPSGAALASPFPWGLRSHWAVSTGNRAEQEGPVRSAQLEYQPKWRNWQTRGTQNPVPARACGFDSHLRHPAETETGDGLRQPGRFAPTRAAPSMAAACRHLPRGGTDAAPSPPVPGARGGDRQVGVAGVRTPTGPSARCRTSRVHGPNTAAGSCRGRYTQRSPLQPLPANQYSHAQSTNGNTRSSWGRARATFRRTHGLLDPQCRRPVLGLPGGCGAHAAATGQLRASRSVTAGVWIRRISG